MQMQLDLAILLRHNGIEVYDPILKRLYKANWTVAHSKKIITIANQLTL
jgi:hypothetical protein